MASALRDHVRELLHAVLLGDHDEVHVLRAVVRVDEGPQGVRHGRAAQRVHGADVEPAGGGRLQVTLP